MTNVWMIRLGKYGESEARALDDGKLATGWEPPEPVAKSGKRCGGLQGSSK